MLIVLGGVLVVAWLIARQRLLPRRPAHVEEQLAGYTVALLALGLVALLVVATNPFALVYLLPTLYAWLWLPQAHASGGAARAALFAAGLAGPLLLLGSLSARVELGLETPWYLVSLTASGYVPLVGVVLAVVWLAAAGQLAALAAGRYGPYDAARPPLLGSLRRSEPDRDARALEL